MKGEKIACVWHDVRSGGEWKMISDKIMKGEKMAVIYHDMLHRGT